MKKYQTAFWIIAILVLTIPSFFPGNWPVYLFKPMIGLILLISVYFQCPSGSIKNLLLMGIVFSWLGDVFLMFPQEEMFLFGLGSFLFCQILYAIVFWKTGSLPLVGFASRTGSLLALIYLTVLVVFLYPSLGELMIPVFGYAIAISIMLILAIGLAGKIDNGISRLIIAGAAFFVISDSLLATDKFMEPLPFSRILVLSTYLVAQYGIVFGVLAHQKEKELS